MYLKFHWNGQDVRSKFVFFHDFFFQNLVVCFMNKFPTSVETVKPIGFTKQFCIGPIALSISQLYITGGYSHIEANGDVPL